jgi:hypothetical protein
MSNLSKSCSISENFDIQNSYLDLDNLDDDLNSFLFTKIQRIRNKQLYLLDKIKININERRTYLIKKRLKLPNIGKKRLTFIPNFIKENENKDYLNSPFALVNNKNNTIIHKFN